MTKLYRMSADQLTEQSNATVDAFLNGLLNDGVITNEQYAEYRKYRLALVPMTFWGKLWNLFKSNGNPDDLIYFVVKPIATGYNTTQEQ